MLRMSIFRTTHFHAIVPLHTTWLSFQQSTSRNSTRSWTGESPVHWERHRCRFIVEHVTGFPSSRSPNVCILLLHLFRSWHLWHRTPGKLHKGKNLYVQRSQGEHYSRKSILNLFLLLTLHIIDILFQGIDENMRPLKLLDGLFQCVIVQSHHSCMSQSRS